MTDTQENVTLDTAKMRMAIDISGYRNGHIARVTGLNDSTISRIKSRTASTARVHAKTITPILRLIGVTLDAVLYVEPPAKASCDVIVDADGHANIDAAVRYLMDQMGVTWSDVLEDTTDSNELF